MPGKVYLVGAGPGDPELLTLRAVKLLRTSDVVLHDDLIGPKILAFVPSTTRLQNVGKRCGRPGISQPEINSLLVQNALLGLQVVRLKGGDPLIFGRAGEEIEALRAAAIDFEIVPGITAALGAAAAAQIPLTHRKLSSAIHLITNHHAQESEGLPSSIGPDATIVIYMPGHDYAQTARNLLRAGLNCTTPCVIVARASHRDQQIYQTTLRELPSTPHLPAPTLLVVGEVVRFARPAGARDPEDFMAVPTEAEFALNPYSQNEEFLK
jgi:uroporphyrin-III C-methyltransferase